MLRLCLSSLVSFIVAIIDWRYFDSELMAVGYLSSMVLYLFGIFLPTITP